MDPIINPTGRSCQQRGINLPGEDPRPGTRETHTRQQQAFDRALNDAERRLEKANLGNEDEAQRGGRGKQVPSEDDEGSDGKIKINSEEGDGVETAGEHPDSGDGNSEDVMEECGDTTNGSGAKSDEEMKDDSENGATAAGQKPPSPIATGRRPWRFDVLSPPILR